MTSDAVATMRFEANKKTLLMAYLFWWFLGGFGAHRFYFGKKKSGAAILCITLLSLPLMFVMIGFFTIMISGIWIIVDAFLIPGMCRDYNNHLVTQLEAATVGA